MQTVCDYQKTEDTELASCDAICEATNFELHTLWQNYFKDTTIHYKNNGGWLTVVGRVGDENIAIMTSFVEIANKKICFWEGRSDLFQHSIAAKYLKSKTKKNVIRESPKNFHEILDRLGIDFRAAKVK